ncbi:hypothetical protein DEJ01_05955 [Curtobacterium sp. MCLR17_040]|uniref:hypothetical protein n=1 Tax=Curtobacterium sp. MCLR17_040 TaxID=2175625 RepID=UPI000DA8A15C|nr:hypothetical protein [Curtobacterium sp. MCLR17_040]PZF05561.1 hypothetical protein DEJ01_05955 [Curtobacterium sp. MCLR17_040]
MPNNANDDRAANEGPLGSEAEVQRAIGSDSLIGLTPEQLTRFVEVLPRLDPETLKMILAQYPELKAQVIEGLGVVRNAYEATLASNDKSQQGVYRAIDRTMDMLQGELDKDGNSEDDRRFLIDSFLRTTQMAADQDAKNKKFLETTFGKTVLATAVGVGLGAAVLAPRLLKSVGSAGGGLRA